MVAAAAVRMVGVLLLPRGEVKVKVKVVGPRISRRRRRHRRRNLWCICSPSRQSTNTRANHAGWLAGN